jgi:hypothetical protein
MLAPGEGELQCMDAFRGEWSRSWSPRGTTVGMVWLYLAAEQSVLHPHGLNMSGRWVGLGYDGRIMSGWASMGQTREEAEKTMASLISSEGIPYVND